MDSEEIRGSRTEKLAKRRKNSRAIYLLLGVFLILLIIWIWMLATSDKKDNSDNDLNQNKVEDKQNKNDENKSNANEDKKDQEKDDQESDSTDDEEDKNESKPEDDKENEDKLEEGTDEDGNNLIENDPEDELVIKTYDNDWEIIATEQEEPHSINFSKDTQDRNEIERAVMQATGLTEEDKMVVWWLENAGEEKIKATVSDREENEISRVHLQWVESKGWQVLKVEVLEENDQKWRFQN